MKKTKKAASIFDSIQSVGDHFVAKRHDLAYEYVYELISGPVNREWDQTLIGRKVIMGNDESIVCVDLDEDCFLIDLTKVIGMIKE